MKKTQEVNQSVQNMTLDQMVTHCHQAAREKGWHDDSDPQNPLQILSWIALVHSELSEALECVRLGDMDTRYGPDGKREGFSIELADALVRILDIAGAMGISLAEAVQIKLDYNRSRSKRHGNKRV